jgi:hypothetical protein
LTRATRCQFQWKYRNSHERRWRRTAKYRIDRAELAGKLLESETSAEDPLRAMAEMIAAFLMEAEVTAKVGAEPHERSAERTTHRNGYRDRRGTRGWLRCR